MLESKGLNARKEDKESIQSVIRLITEKTLMRDYQAINDFFASVKRKSAEESMILVTRRAYVLYLIFSLINQGDFDGENENILTSDAISVLNCIRKNGTENDSCSIVDDIVINGRRITSIYELLMKTSQFPQDNIKIRLIEYCRDYKCLEDGIREKFEPDNPVSQRTWKQDSNLFTKVIIDSCIGYTAFVDSFLYLISENNVNDLLEKIKNGVNLTLGDNVVKKSLDSIVDLYIIHFSLSDIFPELSEEADSDACIRIYHNKEYALFSFIPYVFIKDISYESVKELIANKTDKSTDFFDTDMPDDFYVYFYKYLINKLSRLLFFKVKDSIFADIQIIDRLERKCIATFPSKVASEFDKMFEQEDIVAVYENLIKSHSAETLDVDAGDTGYDIAEKTLDSVITDKHSHGKSLSSLLTDYFYKMKKVDDQRAKEKKDRCVGIRLYEIASKLKQNGFNIYDLPDELIASWDVGDSGCYYDILNSKQGQRYICAIIRQGEQIYNSIYHCYNDVYYYFYLLYEMTGIYQKDDVLQFAKFMDDALGIETFSSFCKLLSVEEEYVRDFRLLEPSLTHEYDAPFYKYLDELNGSENTVS